MRSTLGEMRSLYVLGLVTAVACGGGGGFPDAKPIDSAPPTGTFSLAWSVDGGGNTGRQITLERASDLGCEPVTFMISGGGTYTVDCTTPANAGCIDQTQTLTVMGVPSDNYIIHVKGMVGASTCWTNNDSLQVPAQV